MKSNKRSVVYIENNYIGGGLTKDELNFIKKKGIKQKKNVKDVEVNVTTVLSCRWLNTV